MPYGSVVHIAQINLLILAAKQEPYKKAYLLSKNTQEFSGKSLEERTSRQKNIRQKGKRTRQMNARERGREGERELSFEPSQSQRITSRLNTSFILSPSYSFHKS